MTIEEIKALMSVQPEEGAEDTRLDSVYAEIGERDNKITDLENKVVDLTSKISEMADTNAKLAEQLAYVEPEKKPEEEEPKTEFADFSSMYEED